MTPTYIINLGMGVDSTAILLRWIHEPQSRPFESWDEAIVVTAMTGNEWEQTGHLVTQYLLPLFREHGIRFAQVAKAFGTKTEAKANGNPDNFVVLSDTNHPTELAIDGAFTLAHEMLGAGTVPQVGGTRKCSIKFKGEVLDPFIWGLVGDQPYTQVMGFEANEQGRAVRDSKDGRIGLKNAKRDPDQRTPSYPLIDWGWDRQACLDYIEKVTGVIWAKSACVFCPFALSNKTNRVETLKRFDAHKQEGLLALRMEYNALALNPKQELMTGGLDYAVSQGLWDVWLAALEATPHAIVEVRRVLKRSDRPSAKTGKHTYSWQRSTRIVAQGSRSKMIDTLATFGEIESSRRDGVVANVTASPRFEIEGEAPFTGSEHLFALVTVGVEEKQAVNFEAWWESAPFPQAAEMEA